ncbi:hypothetical protein ACRE_038110 [Hapsidospora chrysogenum ATCC 11550]|uniref:Uncharacterized protein n=1 Tax=Hapsidospora chrysogenum (strain ATCC 11550 / CBS 779.69 / DSM 880 / IAM 14645 / JCM 23072 / IMI 49137) TaxID=857340 RepID=A0A086T7Q1_HAPC1|nr:hypothetical protein ACRE_038110 [Hapsidospora chrysogenum ATCC 11550]
MYRSDFGDAAPPHMGRDLYIRAKALRAYTESEFAEHARNCVGIAEFAAQHPAPPPEEGLFVSPSSPIASSAISSSVSEQPPVYQALWDMLDVEMQHQSPEGSASQASTERVRWSSVESVPQSSESQGMQRYQELVQQSSEEREQQSFRGPNVSTPKFRGPISAES